MTKKANAKERRFQIWVMEFGCCVCGGEALFHHEKQKEPLPRRDHYYGVPLCRNHHDKLHHKFSWKLDRYYKAYGVRLDEISQYYKDKWWSQMK